MSDLDIDGDRVTEDDLARCSHFIADVSVLVMANILESRPIMT